MAKRKRLGPAAMTDTGAIPGLAGTAPLRYSGAPIAHVAGEAATQSALDELAAEMHSARQSGRLVQSLPLESVVEKHMVRDRMIEDPEEMATLKSSLMARGQQTPIEVVELADRRFGLISGWRRLNALRALHAETGEARFATVAALIKPIDKVSDRYVAMVEENEIRVGLSFYERAHLAAAAAELGVYATPDDAVQALFGNSPPAKRSKIKSFVKLHQRLGDMLRFPAAIPEKLGLRLVSALESDPGLQRRLQDRLGHSVPERAEDERKLLEQALVAQEEVARASVPAQEVAPGIRLESRRGRLVLSGAGVTENLQKQLVDWLQRFRP